MSLEFDAAAVARNAHAAETFDLLDRVTVYRAGLEPAALAIIEAELRTREVTDDEIAAHAAEYAHALTHADGTPRHCTFCRRPAITYGWSRLNLFWFFPLLPWPCYLCKDHQPGSITPS